MATEAQSPADLEFQKKEIEVKAVNEKREGIGPRLKVGRTRGKGSQVITFENYDDSQPATLPTTVEAFMKSSGVTTEYSDKGDISLVACLVEGYNSLMYTAASDPLAEFVEAHWPGEAQAQFRIVVRQYSRGANVSLEDAVKLVKPGFEAQYKK